MWLPHGEPVLWPEDWTVAPGVPRTEDRGELLITSARINRGALLPGLFYGVEGMRIGGTRRLEIAPHLGYGAKGLGDRVPAGARLTAEVTLLQSAERRSNS
jgi:hypothetical protein